MEIANKISEIKTEESAMKDRSGHMSLARGLILSFCSIIWNFIVELELEDRVLVPVMGCAMLFFIPIADDDEPELYLISDIVGVALDPLLLYIPIINEDTKCLALDNPLKIVVIIFRSLSDLRYILRILRTIKAGLRGGSRKQIAMRLAIEIVAILPIPHVIILVFLPTMRGLKSLNTMKFLNSLIVLQYLLRVHPIYRVCRDLNKTKLNKNTDDQYPIWIPGLVNFIIYILASHVFGAFWYFFSIQREIDCWGYACGNENGCEFSTSCDDRRFKNVTLLNNLCPINQPNATVFDFGIFLYALQSGMQESTNFPQKFLQCFSWGLRNLSSFASNLNTSTYGWETLFVVLISISGLILFIYLLGHMQTFMQATKKSDRLQQKMKKIIEPKIQSMLSDYDLPSDMKSVIKFQIEQKLEEDEDHDVENIFPILSWAIKKKITRHLVLGKLNKVPKLKDMDGKLLEKVSKYFEPMIYSEGSYIIRAGEPLDKMFFITKGIAMTYMINNGASKVSRTIQLEKEQDDLYGEELLSWAAEPSSTLFNLPISTITVKSLDKVEVFALKAPALQNVVSKFPSYFNTHSTLTEIVVDNNSSHEITARRVRNDISARCPRWRDVSKRAQGYESC